MSNATIYYLALASCQVAVKIPSLRHTSRLNKCRRLHHVFGEPPPESHVAYVTRRASSEPRDSPSRDGERRSRSGSRGEDAVGARGVLVSRGSHLVELSRKPTAEQ